MEYKPGTICAVIPINKSSLGVVLSGLKKVKLIEKVTSNKWSTHSVTPAHQRWRVECIEGYTTANNWHSGYNSSSTTVIQPGQIGPGTRFTMLQKCLVPIENIQEQEQAGAESYNPFSTTYQPPAQDVLTTILALEN